MDLFKSLKGGLSGKTGASEGSNSSASGYSRATATEKQPISERSQATLTSPPGPPPSYREQYAPPPGPPPSHGGQYAPPPGPPPSHVTQYSPPAGPPPSHQEQYAPPPGPPPSHGEQYAPSPGPPPSHQSTNDVPTYHDWTVIPDTSLLPPPPSLGHQSSPAGNANLSEADRAHAWCRMYPLYQPRLPNNAEYGSVNHGDVRLITPREFNGSLTMSRIGAWKGRTRPGSTDSCLLSNLPLYFAQVDSPLRTGATKTVYFEVRILSLGGGRGTDESSLALGFCALPYPTWRMPGWERASLAVHGDDGRRYVNDTWGGKDFTTPIKVGQTVGIGMTFSIPDSPPGYDERPSASPLLVRVFFTRDGRNEGGWDLHEELDAAHDLGVDGLEGNYDLFAALGVFGGAEFEVLFNGRDWCYRGQL